MAYRDAVLATAGLVGYWALDEAANAASFDDAVGVADLTPFGSQLGAGMPSVDDGVTGRALSNNGALRCAVRDAYARAGEGSWEGWLRSTNTATNNAFAIVEGAAAGNPVIALGLGTGGKLRAFIRNAAGVSVQLTSTTTLSDGAWHHVALTCDAANLFTLYLDGVAVGSGTVAGPIGTENFALGGRRTGASVSNPYPGDIDEVGVYGRALTAAEVASHYAARSAAADVAASAAVSGAGALAGAGVVVIPAAAAPAALATLTAAGLVEAPAAAAIAAQAELAATPSVVVPVSSVLEAQAVLSAELRLDVIAAPASSSARRATVEAAVRRAGAAGPRRRVSGAAVTLRRVNVSAPARRVTVG